MACCLLGAAGVALIGLAGRRVWGERAGLIAAALATIYPLLFMSDGGMTSEVLYVPLVALLLLVSYRFAERPGLLAAAAVGAVVGLATRTRSEALLLLPLLAAPLIWRAGPGRLRMGGMCAAAALVVLTPWLVRNWLVLDTVSLLSTNGGFTARAANCPATYDGSRDLGFVSLSCAADSSCSRFANEVRQSDCLQAEATSYAREHVGRLPLVVLARVGRLWEVYEPADSLAYGQANWARPRSVAVAGLVFFFLLLPFALFGLVRMRRRGVTVVPLAAVLALVTIVAAATFGVTRYRAAAEPALVVLAAVGMERWLGGARRR